MVQGPFSGSPKGEAWRAKVEQVALSQNGDSNPFGEFIEVDLLAVVR